MINFELLACILGFEALFCALRLEIGFGCCNLSWEVGIEAPWLDFEPQVWILGFEYEI